MRQIGDAAFTEAVIATKKDAKLVAAAKNDRTNSPASLYREFEKLPLERKREIIAQISSENFVAAQWKIVFPLNNFPADVLPHGVLAAGKALFHTRDEDAVRETVRAIKIYEKSPFLKSIAKNLGEASETSGSDLGKMATILTEPPLYGLVKGLDSANPNSERIVEAVCRVASYTRNAESTLAVANFLYARRHFAYLPDLASLVENSIFLARDERSVRHILDGFTAGSIDVVMQRQNGNKNVLGAIRDIAWKSKNWKVIRNQLQAYLNGG
jgi:hypothetical protein